MQVILQDPIPLIVINFCSLFFCISWNFTYLFHESTRYQHVQKQRGQTLAWRSNEVWPSLHAEVKWINLNDTEKLTEAFLGLRILYFICQKYLLPSDKIRNCKSGTRYWTEELEVGLEGCKYMYVIGIYCLDFFVSLTSETILGKEWIWDVGGGRGPVRVGGGVYST